jgi:hypothetical protein
MGKFIADSSLSVPIHAHIGNANREVRVIASNC